MPGYAQTYSVPTFYLNTDSGKNVKSKDYYIDGDFWIDGNGIENCSIGSKTNPNRLKIKGRGNHTWKRFDKKPYHIKLEKKAPLLGLSESKHFLLMAHADYKQSFLKDEIGFELSRRIGMPWTVKQLPVELILNGEYMGLYFLNEKIRIEEGRLNIHKQKDKETDPEQISGGWLLEITQYLEDNQIRMKEGNGKDMFFEYHSPEILSKEQLDFITNTLFLCDSCIYTNDKRSKDWEAYIDLKTLAKFYIINEIMDNVESFHGSCFLYKDKGHTEKFIFGPVWDFGYCNYAFNDKFIYDKSPYGMTWIEEISKFPRFQDEVRNIWIIILKKGLIEIDDYFSNYVSKLKRAVEADYKRWPLYGTSDVIEGKEEFLGYYNHKVSFLKSVWGGAII